MDRGVAPDNVQITWISDYWIICQDKIVFIADEISPTIPRLKIKRYHIQQARAFSIESEEKGNNLFSIPCITETLKGYYTGYRYVPFFGHSNKINDLKTKISAIRNNISHLEEVETENLVIITEKIDILKKQLVAKELIVSEKETELCYSIIVRRKLRK